MVSLIFNLIVLLIIIKAVCVVLGYVIYFLYSHRKRKEVVFRSNINKDIPTIGNNVTVCANALVNKDVPSNSTVVGNPMRIISK